MSWEAFRLTSKSPSDLYGVLGPHGVDSMIREAMNECWRQHPAETRTLAAVKRSVQTVFDRNLKVWSAIKKPSPAAFFQDLLPNAVDGHIRQAMVLCWMMMPRGKRSPADVRRVVSRIFQRNLDAWESDDRIFHPHAPPQLLAAAKKRKKPGKPIGRKRTR